MNKKAITVLSVLIIIIFIGYIIFDTARPATSKPDAKSTVVPEKSDAWKITTEFGVKEGSLKAVAVSAAGKVYLGGDSFVSGYNSDLKVTWSLKTDSPVKALSNSGDSIFAATINQILVISQTGKVLNEWGPFEDSCLITSVTSNRKYIAFADAGNRVVYILDKGGEVKRMIGQNSKQFVIPSPFFDVALDQENNVFIANTGEHRIEKYSIDGVKISQFGEAGLAPEYFCGCCAPPHFALIPQGFVTAEKGINRIKILDKHGGLIELVNSKNSFIKSEPLDLASADGMTIYGAYAPDSKLYVFTRK